jgi:hypothetical protein
MQYRKVLMALLIGPLMLAEYSAFVLFVTRFFPDSANDDKYRRIQLVLDILLTHAAICLAVAVVTGFIIHKKTTVDVLEIFLCCCFCAIISLPLSLLFPFIESALTIIAPERWMDTAVYGIVQSILLIVAYIFGMILPSILSIRMAKIAQDGS